jgi:hypothetical protein
MLYYIKNPHMALKHGQRFNEFCIKNYNWDDIVKHLMTNLELMKDGKEFI